MSGETNLQQLLWAMSPKLMPYDYVFCTVANDYSEINAVAPLALFREAEGLTLVITKESAIANNLSFSSVFKQITLTVHSSLEAVGLTAAVATKLAEKGISANVIAAYYHDHIFVQADKAALAIAALTELSQ
ncbi:ACT domain-containing protein [Rheinheimera sp. WS51]|uniref:ACT domain-containing protein n=1 Tax=Rheinheimera sp. WS51 TaxID=3425886 RepID=UPI003D8AFD80